MSAPKLRPLPPVDAQLSPAAKKRRQIAEKAFDLYCLGGRNSYRRIGEQLGGISASTVSAYVAAESKRRRELEAGQAAEFHRDVAMARLDLVIGAAFEAAVKGRGLGRGANALNTVIKAVATQCALLGLNAPVKIELEEYRSPEQLAEDMRRARKVVDELFAARARAEADA